MSVVTLEELKSYFNSGDVPTEQHYIDLIDTLSSLGGGDMYKSTYDSNGDDSVDSLGGIASEDYHHEGDDIVNPNDLLLGSGGIHVGEAVISATSGKVTVTEGYRRKLGGSYYDIGGYYALSSQILANSSALNGGASSSSAAKTLIDMSAEFTGLPNNGAGVKAYHCYLATKDSAQETSSGPIGVYAGHNNTAYDGVPVTCGGRKNGYWERHTCLIPADSNGDVYLQKVASGSGTLDIYWVVLGIVT